MIETILTVLGSLLTGGFLVKIFDKFFMSKKDEASLKLDEATRLRDEADRIRKELRTEIDYLKEKMSKMEKEVDDWRDKYYKLMEEHTGLSIKYRLLKSERETQLTLTLP